MILNFYRHFFTSDKFFHILIPFLKKKTVDPFFALGKNQKGKLFVQDCNTHSLVPFLFEAQCTVRTYPFLFETEDFSPVVCRIHTYPVKKVTENASFRKRSPEWGFLKTPFWVPVNAHAPVKDGAVFSNYCVFHWTGKKD